jgi:hypothetical protein
MRIWFSGGPQTPFRLNCPYCDVHIASYSKHFKCELTFKVIGEFLVWHYRFFSLENSLVSISVNLEEVLFGKGFRAPRSPFFNS